MYKSLEDEKNLTVTDFTQIIYFVIKILNKHRSNETNEVNITELPDGPEGKNLEVATRLLKELDIENISEQDDKIDAHINALFEILNQKLKLESTAPKRTGKEILEIFRKSSS